MTARVRVWAPARRLTAPMLREGSADPLAARIAESEVWFGKPCRAAVYDREGLLAGNLVQGPALIIQMDATTAVPPEWRGVVGDDGSLVLTRG